MSNVLSFDMDAKSYLDVAVEKRKRGDLFGAARFAKAAIKADDKNVNAYILLSDIYADNAEIELSNKTLFKALHKTKPVSTEEIDFRLINNFMRLDMPDVVMYYASLYGDEFFVENIQNSDENDMFLYYPRTNEYYEHLISDALAAADSGDIERAVKMLSVVPDDSPAREAANRALLMLYGVKRSQKSLIECCEELLARFPDSAVVRCTLAAAYLSADKKEEAESVACPLFEKEYEDSETLFLLIHLATGLQRDGDVVSLISKLLKLRPNRFTRLLIWLSQGLYNIGHYDEAREAMVRVRDLYGEDSPAAYYLELFTKRPERVEYNLVLPSEGYLYNEIEAHLISCLKEDDLIQYENEHCSESDNVPYFIHWSIAHGQLNVKADLLMHMMQNFDEIRVSELLQNSMVSDELSYEMLSQLIFCMMKLTHMGQPCEFDIVTQGRFKHVKFRLPETYNCMPRVFEQAVQLAYSDIILTDEDPDEFLWRLPLIVDSIATLDDKGEFAYARGQGDKISSLKSEITLAAVLLGRVYRDEETRDDIIKRYGLNARLYDRYYKLVFGDDND